FFFRDHDIVVAGGGDSAMEEATFLTKFAKSVTVVHRREEFRASKIMLERARANEKIKWKLNSQITGVVGDTKVEALKLKDTQDGSESTLDVSGGVFAAGDLVDRTYRQAITASGSGCSAAIDAERWLAETKSEEKS
ncbi:NAD(P)/FAD-dependent oxidoreductase, partial [Amycolatopsis sp. NPDC088138]|uniref:NAD(P)/FAD-dependent oxidoreductase n=1 Tax=Amycolatopsis sp. NPDC088138 TaxID=3363938 RepID=UPI00380DD096